MAEGNGKPTEIPTGSLIPQPHGGALRNGGPSRPHGGRPPDKFRRLCRQLVANRKLVHRLADIAEAKIGQIVETKEGRIYCETPVKEQRLAIDALLKYGLGANPNADQALIAKLGRITGEVFGDDPRLEELHRRWVEVIGAHLRGDG